MTQNVAKMEQARRVWRLNKKEGVPVLEALETAEISKDTYYEYKRKYESDWESQLLTVQEVEERLEELSDELNDLTDYAGTVEEKLEEADDTAEIVDRAHAAHERAAGAEELADRMERRLQQLEKRVGYQFDPDEQDLTLEGMDERLNDFRKRLNSMEETVGTIDRRLKNLENKHSSDMAAVWEDMKVLANQGMFESTSPEDLNHNF